MPATPMPPRLSVMAALPALLPAAPGLAVKGVRPESGDPAPLVPLLASGNRVGRPFPGGPGNW